MAFSTLFVDWARHILATLLATVLLFFGNTFLFGNTILLFGSAPLPVFGSTPCMLHLKSFGSTPLPVVWQHPLHAPSWIDSTLKQAAKTGDAKLLDWFPVEWNCFLDTSMPKHGCRKVHGAYAKPHVRRLHKIESVLKGITQTCNSNEPWLSLRSVPT